MRSFSSSAENSNALASGRERESLYT
jgi:hypothetical protein